MGKHLANNTNTFTALIRTKSPVHFHSQFPINKRKRRILPTFPLTLLRDPLGVIRFFVGTRLKCWVLAMGFGGWVNIWLRIVDKMNVKSLLFRIFIWCVLGKNQGQNIGDSVHFLLLR